MAGPDDESRGSSPQYTDETGNTGEADADDRWNEQVRGETPLQREDRRYAELLQEVRVAQTGVQILLAFLLTVAFSPRFGNLQPYHRTIYIVTLLLGAGATALLIAPVAIHRLTFAQRLKPQLVRVANVLTVSGLTLLMLTIGSALLLIFDLMMDLNEAIWLAGAVVAWFAVWWYVLPVAMRVWHSRRPDENAAYENPHAGQDDRHEHDRHEHDRHEHDRHEHDRHRAGESDRRSRQAAGGGR